MNSTKLASILKAYNIKEVVTNFKPLSSFANEVFLIELNQVSYVLKRHLVSTKEEVLIRIGILEELTSQEINIPRIYKNTDNRYLTDINGEIYELSEYINHKDLNYIEYNITKEELDKAGTELKKIHSAKFANKSLKQIDFSAINTRVSQLITDFNDLYKSDVELDQKTKGKAGLISEFIQKTDTNRSDLFIKSLLYKIPKNDYVLIHGDYSLSNLLPSIDDNKLYITDWDGMKCAPQLFELQRALGLLCSMGRCNANLDEFNTDRVCTFLSGYNKSKWLGEKEIEILVEVAKYCFYIYWLDFTLSQTLKGDYRILEIFPTDLEIALYWERSFETYREFLLSLI